MSKDMSPEETTVANINVLLKPEALAPGSVNAALRQAQLERYQRNFMREIDRQAALAKSSHVARAKFSNKHLTDNDGAVFAAMGRVDSQDTFVAAAKGAFKTLLRALPVACDRGEFAEAENYAKTHYELALRQVHEEIQALKSTAIKDYLKAVAGLKTSLSEDEREEKQRELRADLKAEFSEIERDAKENLQVRLGSIRDHLTYTFFDPIIEGAGYEANRPLLARMEEHLDAFDEGVMSSTFEELLEKSASPKGGFFKRMERLSHAVKSKNGTAFQTEINLLRSDFATDLAFIHLLGELEENYDANNKSKALEKVQEIGAYSFSDDVLPEFTQIFDEQHLVEGAKVSEHRHDDLNGLFQTFHSKIDEQKQKIERLCQEAPGDLPAQLMGIYLEAAKEAFAESKILSEKNWRAVKRFAEQSVEKQMAENKAFLRDYYFRSRLQPDERPEGVTLNDGKSLTSLRDLKEDKTYRLASGAKLKRSSEGVLEYTLDIAINRKNSKIIESAIFAPVTLPLRAALLAGREGWARWKAKGQVNKFKEELDMIGAFADGPIMISCRDPKLEKELRALAKDRGIPVVALSDGRSPVEIALAARERRLEKAKAEAKEPETSDSKRKGVDERDAEKVERTGWAAKRLKGLRKAMGATSPKADPHDPDADVKIKPRSTP